MATHSVTCVMTLPVCACAGVMVTASHNPKQDDGYKVYWSNGAQIISPVDKGIADAIAANAEPWPECVAAYTSVATHADVVRYATSLGKTSLVVEDTEALIASYLSKVSTALCRHRAGNASGGVKIAYTAMHGVGTPFAQDMFKAFNLAPFTLTPEQCTPDYNFPTVTFPNPEEGKGTYPHRVSSLYACLSMCVCACDVRYCYHPRLQVTYRHGETRHSHYFIARLV